MKTNCHAELYNKWMTVRHMAFLTALTIMIVTLRITSRLMQWGYLSTAEYLLLLSTVSSVSFNAILVYTIEYTGLGAHIYDVCPAKQELFFKLYFVASLLLYACFAAAKLSLLWLLHEIRAYTLFRNVVRFLAAFMIVWWIVSTIMTACVCLPIQSTWNGTCKNWLFLKLFPILFIPWMVTDWLVLITPLPIVWKNVDTRRSRPMQIALLMLFGLGIITCCISIKRYLTLLQLDQKDPFFTGPIVGVWTMIECTTTICCAALPGSMYALSRILPIEAMKRVVTWVERKLHSLECRSVSRTRRTDGIEADVSSPPNRLGQQESPFNLRIEP